MVGTAHISMGKWFRLASLGLLVLGPALCREVPSNCGTSRIRTQEDLHRHRRSVRLRRAAGLSLKAASAVPAAARDLGGDRRYRDH